MGSFLLTIVSNITGRRGHKGWILNNLNESRLDYYYAFLAVLSFLNFVFFWFVSYCYEYKRETTEAFGKDAEKAIETVALRKQKDEDAIGNSSALNYYK